MQAYWTLVKRELGTQFFSWTGYVTMAVATFLLGTSFSSMLQSTNRLAMELPLTELFYKTYYFWLILLLATPLITMRTFAWEKATGTFEALMTTPVSDLQVVLAKFTGALLFYLLTWLPLLGCLWMVQRYSDGQEALEFGQLCSTYLGILVLGAFYLSIGCFASSLTRSQVVAAISALAAGLAIFMVCLMTLHHGLRAGWQGRVLAHVSLVDHMRDFARGVIDTRALVFCLSFTWLFLFLTLRSIESRRWR